MIDAFAGALALEELDVKGVAPGATGRPSYHPSVFLKICVYGYLNGIASNRPLERETQRNIEMMWLTGRLTPDFKTIANFRKVDAKAMRAHGGPSRVFCGRHGFDKPIAANLHGHDRHSCE